MSSLHEAASHAAAPPPGLCPGLPALREAGRPQALLGLRTGVHQMSGHPPPHLPTPPHWTVPPFSPRPPHAACCLGAAVSVPLGVCRGRLPGPGIWCLGSSVSTRPPAVGRGLGSEEDRSHRGNWRQGERPWWKAGPHALQAGAGTARGSPLRTLGSSPLKGALTLRRARKVRRWRQMPSSSQPWLPCPKARRASPSFLG